MAEQQTPAAVIATAAVAINDQTYALARVAGAWQLTKPDGTAYRVRRGACSCPYNGVRREPDPGGCKHEKGLRQLGFLALEEEGRPPEPAPPTAEEIQAALAAPFDPSEVKAKPAVITGSRALAMFYADARVIQNRLDDVLGVVGWQDEYECLADGSVVCRLRLRLGEEWVTKMDVGGPSEQPDGGDRVKAAFSDALKRAAVKFGVGRYLYRVPPQWVDYDPQKKRFVHPPRLPDVAHLPVAGPAPKGAPAPTVPGGTVDGGATITEAQGQELKALCKQHGVTWERFAQHYAIKRLGELPAVHFEDARRCITAPQSVLKLKSERKEA